MRLRRPLGALWLLLFLLTLVGLVGGLWHASVSIPEIEPAFAAVGLKTTTAKDGPGFAVEARQAPGIPEGSRIERINGTPLPQDSTELEAARRLKGAEGSRVTLHVRTPHGALRTVVQTRRHARHATSVARKTALDISLVTLFGLLAITYVGAAVMLWRRRSRDPVSVILSFAFLAIASLGAYSFWEDVGGGWVNDVLSSSWLALLIVAFPVFPDGRFVPRWSRWLLVLGPLVVIVTTSDILPKSLAIGILVALLLASLASLVLRYRRTRVGLERQQIKWAAFGFIGGVALLLISFGLIGISPLLELSKGWGVAFGSVVLLLLFTGFFVMPLGVILSLLRYRLNDADMAIGRSTGYAAVTAVFGSVWAVSAYWVQEMLPDFAGEENKGIATAAAGLVAVAIFSPARKRLLRWSEARFQRALVTLRAVPVRLAQLQHGDDPREVAGVALGALVEGIGARSAALIAEGGELLASHGPQEESQPISIALTDPGGPVAKLLLGNRTDGAPYSTDQRAAIAMVAAPLADALRATLRRSGDRERLERALATITERLRRLEEGTPTLPLAHPV
jgi:hypothetical protein